MYLIQLLLPLYDNDKQLFSRLDFDNVRKVLTERFGGVTAFLQSPGQGFWQESDDNVTRDDVVIFEVMTDELEEGWWANYRQNLQQTFRQEKLVVRALKVTQL